MSLKVPNTFVLIFLLIALVAGLTWVVPGGEFDRVEKNGRQVVEPGTFEVVESEPQGLVAIFLSPIKGFVDAAEIIGFVLLVGGAFGAIQHTGAIDAALRSLALAQERSRLLRLALIPIFMVVFSLGGATFGMSEETIPFVLIFVPLALSLGYDSIVGVAIPFVGAGAGFASAFLNPFTVGVAQGIAEVDQFSGLEYRLVCWVVITTVAIVWVMRYAAKIQAKPELSLVYDIDQRKRESGVHWSADEHEGMTTRQRWVLIVFALGLVALVIGVLQAGWYIQEIAALFLAIGVIGGLVGGLKGGELVDAMLDGTKALVATAMLIAFARAVLVVAQDGRIIDTVLNALSGVIGGVHPIVSSQVMFVLQSVLNFLVPSGSGQAALTMPIMAPLADLVGVSRQTAVLAFQFGDGFSNLIVPTSAICMGVLTLAEIPWDRWVRWMLPLQAVFLLIGFLLLIPAHFIW
ncbi:MAG: AbgT family transporter [Acidobacteriota bacterium]